MPVETYVTDDGLVFSVMVNNEKSRYYTGWTATGAGPKQFKMSRKNLEDCRKKYRQLKKGKVNPYSMHSMLKATEDRIGKTKKTKNRTKAK
jgi:ubiquitin